MKKNLLLLVVSLSVALTAAEMGLRWFTVFPVNTGSNRKFHRHLLYTLEPSLYDVDSDGFRNPATYDGEEIIAIGDSHTYGNNVARKYNWPSQLEGMIEEEVYNYGVGSYSIYQYGYLINRPPEHDIQNIIIALFPANDFRPKACRVLALRYWQRKIKQSNLSNRPCHESIDRSEYTEQTDWTERLVEPIKQLAFVNSMDVLLVEKYYKPFENWLETDNQATSKLSLNNGDKALTIRKKYLERLRTWTDLSDTRVKTHFDNFKLLFKPLPQGDSERRKKISFLFIPSKARVYRDWFRNVGKTPPEVLQKAVQNEVKLTNRIKKFLNRTGIPFHDVSEKMTKLTKTRSQGDKSIYKFNDDHPYKAGYRIYAKAAKILLK